MKVFNDIPGYEGKYAICEYGHVFSYKTNKILSTGYSCPNKKGYLQVVLDGKTQKVHKLVAKTYLDAEWTEKLEINHRDGNRFNNHYSNLEFVTHLNNMRHAQIMGLVSQSRGQNHGHSKLTETEVLEIRRLRKQENLSYEKIAQKFPVNRHTIGDICRRITWTHI